MLIKWLVMIQLPQTQHGPETLNGETNKHNTNLNQESFFETLICYLRVTLNVLKGWTMETIDCVDI